MTLDIEECVDIIRDVMNNREALEKQRVIFHEAMCIADTDGDKFRLKRLKEECEIKASEEWDKIRPALKKLKQG